MPASIFPRKSKAPTQQSELVDLTAEALQAALRRTQSLIPDDLDTYDEGELQAIGEGNPDLDTFEENALYKAAAMLKLAKAALGREDAGAAAYATTTATYFIGTVNAPPSPSLSEHQQHAAMTRAEKNREADKQWALEWAGRQGPKSFRTLTKALETMAMEHAAKQGGKEGTFSRRVAELLRYPGNAQDLRAAFALICQRALPELRQASA